MKKMLQRSFSIILALSLCLVAMQITVLADTVTKAGFQSLSEWVEMADDLLSRGKEYSSGKSEFDAAYDNAVNLLEAGIASDEEITDCIEDLKTAWAGLKIESVTEIAPVDGVAIDTGSALLGDYYAVVERTYPKFTYVVNAGKDFWNDVSEVYVYAYAYTTSYGTTGTNIEGTTLPIGNKGSEVNYIYLSACDSNATWSHINGGETYLTRGSLKKFSFTNDKLVSKYSDTANLIFQLQKANAENVTMTAGSLFIVRSSSEQVPISYELFKWVNRAENLLSQGKTYVAGLDEFNTAIDAAKNATDVAEVDTLISNIKTAWQALEYVDVIEIAPVDGVENNTGCTGFGNYYKTLAGKIPAVKYEISEEARTALADATEIYVYAYGYDTESGTNDIEICKNLYQGVNAPSVGHIRITDTGWKVNKYPTCENKLTRGVVRKYTFEELPDASTIQFALGEDATVSTTIVVGSLFIVKGQKTEKLPSDRLFNWIDRAEELLGADVAYSDGLEQFNAAITAMYNADVTSNEDTLVADLRAAWNNLYYDETVAIGAPSVEGGNDITDSYTKEDDRLGDDYVCVQSNGKAMSVRLDCDAETGFPTEWFNNVKEIYFYTRGYQTENTTQKWSSQWTNATLNTSFSTSVYCGGSNVNYAFSKYSIDKDTVLKELNGAAFRNILVTQYELNEANTWIVGTLYATKTYKISLADYGDVNGDGLIDVKDLVRAKKYFAGITNEIEPYALDMNDDDKNAANDLVSLRNKLLNADVAYADNTVLESEVY